MSTGKLIALMVGWVLASIAIAVVISIVVTEFLVLLGFIDWSTREYAWAINGIALAGFVVLVSVPLVFRRRFVDPAAQSTDE